jgi:hypothetical protein
VTRLFTFEPRHITFNTLEPWQAGEECRALQVVLKMRIYMTTVGAWGEDGFREPNGQPSRQNFVPQVPEDSLPHHVVGQNEYPRAMTRPRSAKALQAKLLLGQPQILLELCSTVSQLRSQLTTKAQLGRRIAQLGASLTTFGTVYALCLPRLDGIDGLPPPFWRP